MTSKKRKLVRGAGGGGKSGDGGAHPVEASDSLHSKQFAKVLDLISEGPIVGLVDGVNSVYLNETPLATAGVFNFKDVGINWTLGTQTQLQSAAAQSVASQYGFDAVRYPNSVGVQIMTATPVVRTLTSANVNTIIVTVFTPSLLSRDDTNGNTNPSSVALRIDLQSAGGGYVTKISDTISGKTTTKYQRSYAIDVSGSGPWDIRITKLTADSASQLLENQLWFDDFTGVISTRLTYPNSAIIAASIDSQQFQQVPSRAYDIKGLIVKVPSNYNPTTRVYTGTWDGTFVPAWTDNPAWCYYDMLTNSRYGLGDFIDASQVDKWGLYTIAQYCDQLVPSGIGSATEPRFTCNLYLQSPAEAYKVVQNMASIFRAITFWSTGSVTVVQDSPQNPLALFTNANVVDGAFNYTGVSIKARHTVAQISWNDPSDFYRQKIEYVQDDDGVKLYGVKRAELVAFGCTSRGQANRLGKWLLYSEKAETETVTFRAGLDGFTLYPGAIIKTSDLNRAGQRMGGRIVSATTTSATLDSAVTIAAGKTYTLSVIEPDGTIQKVAASASVGQQTVLTFPALPAAPQVNALFIFEANDLVAETWRIIGVSQPEHHLVEVTALKHDPTKFAQIELGQQFDAPIVSAITAVPSAPTGLQVRTSPYSVNGAVVGLRATLSWQSREGAFRVRWRQAGAIWNERRVTESTIDIDNIDYTAYEFQVYSINRIGRESDVAALNQTITVPPVTLPALANLVLEGGFTSKICKIKWDACPGATSYRVEVRDTASNTSRRIVNVGNALRFDYNSADMRGDGGPWRALTFYVTPLGQFGSASAAAGSLAVTNPQVGAINGVALTGGLKTVFLTYTTPADNDFVGVQVWLSTDPACPTVAGNLVYTGNDSLLVFRALTNGTALVGGTNYYVKISGYDDFGQDSLTYSGSLLVVPAANAPDANSITAAMVQAGILDLTKFASGLAPIGVVSALPTVAGYTGSQVIYNTTDGKLYRLTGGAWVASVAAADVTGQLGDAQLSAIAAAKLTGQITAPQLNVAIGGGNLAGNSSFEAVDGANQPYGYAPYNNAAIAVTMLRITGRQKGFAFGLRAGAASSSSFGIYGTNTVTLGGLAGGVNGGWLPNTTYVISFYAKKVAGAAWSGLQLGWNTSPATTVVLSQPSPTTAWQRYAFRITTGAAVEANGNIFITVSGNVATNDEIHIDDLQIEQGDTLTAYAPMPGEIQPASIGTTQITDNAVTSAKVVAGAIVAGKIAAGVVTATEIAASTITATNIAAGAITTAKLAAGAVTANEIAANTITAGNIAAGAVTATTIAAGAVTTAKLAAGAVTANEIAANTITAGQIQAGAISTAQLAAGAITTSKLAITSGGANLGTDPYFNDFPNAWTNTASVSAVSGSAYFAGSSPAPTGIRSTSQVSPYSAQAISIDPNKTYRLSGHVYSESGSGNNRSMYLLVDFFDSDGIHVTTSWGGAYSGYPVSGFVPNNADFVMVQGTFGAGQTNTIPGNVKSCKIGCILMYGGTSGTAMRFTGLRLEEVLPGTLIQDGAITTNKILAGAVTADRLLANSITAGQIAANTITAGQIAAGTITGNLIAANTIQADKLQIGGRNLLPNAGPAPGTSAGFVDGGGNMTGAYSFGQSATIGGIYVPEGGGGVYVSAAGTQTAGNYRTLNSNYGNLIPCTAGKLYEGSCYLSAFRCNGVVDIIWYNASSVYITSSTGTAVNNNAATGPLSAFSRSTVIATAPAGAAFMLLRTICYAIAGTTDPYLFCSNWYLSEAVPGQTVASPWSASASTTIDGAGIRTASIAADRIVTTSLSVISPTIGTLRTASSGGRTEIVDNAYKVYDPSNTKRVQLGDLSIT